MQLRKRLRKLCLDPVAYCLDSHLSFLRFFGNVLRDAESKKHRRIYSSHSAKKISVIMSVYNNGHFFEESLLSILTQTHENLEVIIVDDAADDDIAPIVRRLADPRIQLYKASKNCGPYICRNFAMRMADGEYITFQDGDDISLPQRLEIQLGALLSSRNAKACYAYRLHIDENGDGISVNDRNKSLAYVTLFFPRQEILKNIGFFDRVRFAGDHEYISRIKAFWGRKAVVKSHEAVYLWRAHENSLTNKGQGAYQFFHKDGQTQIRRNNPLREAYERIFSLWHANRQIVDGHSLYYPPEGDRPFNAPAAMMASDEDVNFIRII